MCCLLYNYVSSLNYKLGGKTPLFKNSIVTLTLDNFSLVFMILNCVVIQYVNLLAATHI